MTEKSIQEIDAILRDIQESWDNAPCRLSVFGKNGDEYEKMAWERVLSGDEQKRVSLWVFAKFDNTVTLLWDSGVLPPADTEVEG